MSSAGRLANALTVVVAAWLAAAAQGDPLPEEVSVLAMPAPQPHWFMTVGATGGYLFDGGSGQMIGKIDKPAYGPAITVDHQRGMLYVPGSYYSRGSYGERTDAVVFHALDGLVPVAEVEVPPKIAAIGHRGMNNLVGGRLLAVYNLTPAASVSIVDVQARTFAGEIATAGCAMVYPLDDARFMQICGDGTLQVIGLDADGSEASRERSARFFDVDQDPLFDYAVPSAEGWILVSHEGQVFAARFDQGIDTGEPWRLTTEADATANWRAGGGQPFAFHESSGTLYALMHQGGKDTHSDPGTEIWAFKMDHKRRALRIELPEAARAINVVGKAQPLLIVLSTEPRTVLVHDANTGRLLRRIDDAGQAPSRLQRF